MLRVLNAYVNGLEALTLKKITEDKIEAFEMWWAYYWSTLRISYKDNATNDDVLRKIELLDIIKVRKLKYLRRMMRNINFYS